jgi:hypothetical protein
VGLGRGREIQYCDQQARNEVAQEVESELNLIVGGRGLGLHGENHLFGWGEMGALEEKDNVDIGAGGVS